MWFILLLTALLLALAAIVYLVRGVHRTTPFQRLGARRPLLGWLAAVAAVGLTGLFAWINVTTVIVVILHLVVFWLLCDLLARLAGRLMKREIPCDWRAVAALALTAVCLGAGWFMAHHVCETHYALTTDKPLPNGRIRLAVIGDAHLGVTLDGAAFAAQLERVAEAAPDAVVIVGDFVDDDSRYADVAEACRALGAMDAPGGVYFCYGNHDEGYFRHRDFTGDQLRAALEDNGIAVLADGSALIDGGWYIVGRKDRVMAGRMDAAALTAGLDASKYIVMLDHQPNDYAAEAESGADLVLSGHTHGGHIFPMGQLAVMLGINDCRYGLSRRGDTDFIVTSGISGWAVPFKTGTYSEFAVVDVVSR